MVSTKKVLFISAAVTALLILVEVLFVHPHAEYWWHEFVAFDAIYGFIGCTLIIVLSKLFGKQFIQRPEHFWDGGDDTDV